MNWPVIHLALAEEVNHPDKAIFSRIHFYNTSQSPCPSNQSSILKDDNISYHEVSRSLDPSFSRL